MLRNYFVIAIASSARTSAVTCNAGQKIQSAGMWLATLRCRISLAEWQVRKAYATRNVLLLDCLHACILEGLEVPLRVSSPNELAQPHHQGSKRTTGRD